MVVLGSFPERTLTILERVLLNTGVEPPTSVEAWPMPDWQAGCTDYGKIVCSYRFDLNPDDFILGSLGHELGHWNLRHPSWTKLDVAERHANEFAADQWAATNVDRGGLVSMLRKLTEHTPNLVHKATQTHPSLADRLSRLGERL